MVGRRVSSAQVPNGSRLDDRRATIFVTVVSLWRRRRVVARSPHMYPHRYPQKYPHRSCHPSPPLSSPHPSALTTSAGRRARARLPLCGSGVRRGPCSDCEGLGAAAMRWDRRAPGPCSGGKEPATVRHVGAAAREVPGGPHPILLGLESGPERGGAVRVRRGLGLQRGLVEAWAL